ncbi:uncharacterized protein [Asterias amurensis]|uniref:uncharacterized protein isoform X7 n=1 Tax=Asterias amurensis TaxID=7602 RepID=UPI003AB8F1D1
MALCSCIRNSRVSNFNLYSWMLLFMFSVLTVISTASIVPSLSGYKTKQRRQRRGDVWIGQALNSICPWAECRGWIGCNQMMNPPSECPSTPANFRVLEAYDVTPPHERMDLGTCYGYSPPGDPAPDDWCKDGPRKDECACFNMESLILRIGYSDQGITTPKDDAPIGDLCESRITSLCTTTPPTIAASTTFLPTTSSTIPKLTGGGPTSASSPATPTTTPRPAVLTSSQTTSRLLSQAISDVPPPNEGSIYIDHWYIWPLLVVAMTALASCLLVALHRRRSNVIRTTLTRVTATRQNDVEMDEDGYLAVNRLTNKVSTTHDNENAQSDKSVAAYQELKTTDPGGYAELRPYQELKISSGRSAEPLQYEEPKISSGSADILLYEEPKISSGGSAEILQYEEPKISSGSADVLQYEEPKISSRGPADILQYEEPKISDRGSDDVLQLEHPIWEPIRSYDHAEPYAQMECSGLTPKKNVNLKMIGKATGNLA